MKLDTWGKGQVPCESCSGPDSPLASRGRHMFPVLCAGLPVGSNICQVSPHIHAMASSCWPHSGLK